MNQFWINNDIAYGHGHDNCNGNGNGNILNDHNTNDNLTAKIEEEFKRLGSSNDQDNLTAAAERLLSDEYNRLTVQDRNAIQEEMHGVNCMARKESSEFLRCTLIELEQALYTNGVCDTTLYITATQQRIYHALYSTSNTSGSSYTATTNNNATTTTTSSSSSSSSHHYYVKSTEFRLMYLRSELFHVTKTVQRIIQAMEFLYTQFGPYALERRIRIEDFASEEVHVMRRGNVQVFPFRDRYGRRIIFWNPAARPHKGEDNAKYRQTMTKILYYFDLVCGLDADVQRKGTVVLAWLYNLTMPTMQSDFPWKTRLFFHLCPTRKSTFHMCGTDTPMMGLVKAAILVRAPRRVRFVFNFGTMVEVNYKLLGYGICVSHLPVTYSGNIKTSDVRRLMKIRSYLEAHQPARAQQQQEHHCNNNHHYDLDSYNNNTTKISPTNNSSADTIISHEEPYPSLPVSSSTILSSSLPSQSPSSLSISSSLTSIATIVECPSLNDILIKKGYDRVDHPGNDILRCIVQSVYYTHHVELIRNQHLQQQQQKTQIRRNVSALLKPVIVEIKRQELRILCWNSNHSWWNIITESNYERQLYKKVLNIVKQHEGALLAQ